MPTYAVGSGQTYTTPQAAIDAIVALGDLTGTGDHVVMVDNGYSDSGAPIDPNGAQPTENDRIIVTSLGRYTLNTNAPLVLRNHFDIERFDLVPQAGFSGVQAIDGQNVDAASGGTVSNVRHFRLTNPNAQNLMGIDAAANWRGVRISDGFVSGFNVNPWLYGVGHVNNVERVTVFECGIGFDACVTVTDCAAANSTGNDFNSITTLSYSASSDATATGTGSITNIDPLVEFVDAANDDFTLANGSQLLGTGSTGGDIGGYQAPVANVAPVADDDTFSIAVDAANGSVIGQYTATDSDGTIASYSISGSVLAIDNAGQITLADNSGLSVGTPIVATVTATDDDGATDTGVITVNVVAALNFAFTSATAGPYRAGDQVTIVHVDGAASGKTLSTPAGTISLDSESATQSVFTVPNIETFGDRSTRYDQDIVFTLESNGEQIQFTRQVTTTAGDTLGTITSVTGIYADDTDVAVGDIARGRVVNGTFQAADLTTGVLIAGAGGEFSYNVYDVSLNQWAGEVTEIVPADPVPVLEITANSSNPLPASVSVSGGSSYDLKQHFNIPNGLTPNFARTNASGPFGTGVSLSANGVISNAGTASSNLPIQIEITAS